jgi:hypothetical protein
MKRLEDEFDKIRINLDNIEVPEEFEIRLRNRLYRKKSPWLKRHSLLAASIALIFLLAGFNYDIIAYYGKKIAGYDEILMGSLKDINELGMGQEIGKSCKIGDGFQLILDGVVYDENQMVLLYKIKSEKPMELIPLRLNVKGIFGTYHMKGGYGKLSEDKKEFTMQDTFEAPALLDKFITIKAYTDKGEHSSLSFTLNRNKAMQKIVKQNVNKTVESNGIKYTITSISASALSTVIDGYMEGENIAIPEGIESRTLLNVALNLTYHNGGNTKKDTIKASPVSLSSSSDHPGRVDFQYKFDGLKPNIEEITLALEKLSKGQLADKNLIITPSTKDLKFDVKGEEFTIKNVEYEDSNKDTVTVINILTNKNISFNGIGLFDSDKEMKPLEETVKAVQINGKDLELKIFKFLGKGDKMKVLIKEISFDTPINKQIEIYKDK